MSNSNSREVGKEVSREGHLEVQAPDVWQQKAVDDTWGPGAKNNTRDVAHKQSQNSGLPVLDLFDGVCKDLTNKIDAVTHAVQAATEGLFHGESKAVIDLDKASSGLLTDMQSKGLLDKNIKPSASGATVFESRENALLSVSKEGEFVAMQWDRPGGKVTRFHDQDNAAIVVEPKDGGSIVFDEKTNKVTIENSQGKKVENSRGQSDKDFFDAIASAKDFKVEWKKDFHFDVKLK